MRTITPPCVSPLAAAKLLKLVLAATCAFSATSCANAAPADEIWRCTAANGMFDRFEMPIAPETREFSGEMVFHKADFGRWGPVASVGFEDSSLDAAACKCNGIKARAFEEYPDVIGVYLLVDGQETELGSVPYDKPVTFKFSFNRMNQAKLEVGTGVQYGMPRHAARDMLKLSCSSADVSFRNIKVRAGEPSW